MKIIIAGAGKVGYSVARSLAAEGHDVTVLDRDEEAIGRISNSLDVICVEGSATNPDALREAGAEDADLLVAATPHDEVNMVSCIAAKKLGTKDVIARVRDPEYLSQRQFLRDVMGLSKLINPDYECAKEISRILRFPSAVRVDAFSKGDVEIIEYRIPQNSVLGGMALKNMPATFGAKVLVAVAERENEAVIPNGDFVLRSGDMLSITGTSEELRKFFVAVKAYKKPVRNVLIAGGSRIAVYLSRILIENGMNVTVVDKSRDRCEALCDLIPEGRVIFGDATVKEVLLEEGLSRADAFVSVTGDDGDNIITSMYAAFSGVGKVVTKVNREHFSEILESSHLESIVSTREIVAQQITSYVRAMANSASSSFIETLHKLADGRIEALEFKVGEGAGCVGVPLKNLKIKKNTLIGAIIRDNESIIPDGSTVIRPGDHAVVISAAGKLGSVNEILEGSL